MLFAQVFILLLFALTAGVLQAATGQVTLAWDPVDDSRVARYEVHYGSASKSYQSQVQSTTAQTQITGLTSGATYFFAARACSSDGTLCSAFSNELSITVPVVPDPIPDPEPDPEPVLPEMTTALTSPTGTANLTSEGLSDWVHWGLANVSSITRKAGVTPQIGSLTTFGGKPSRFSVNTRLGYSWTDGAPKASATTTAGLLIKGLNKGFELRVPAHSGDRTLVLYLGGSSSRGKVEVSVSDNSAEPYSMVLEDLTKAFDRRLVIPVKAASAGQEVIVQYTQVIARGSISVQAATLQNKAVVTSEGAVGQTNSALESSLQTDPSGSALPSPGSLNLVPKAPR